jgi:hypothetical protein
MVGYTSKTRKLGKARENLEMHGKMVIQGRKGKIDLSWKICFPICPVSGPVLSFPAAQVSCDHLRYQQHYQVIYSQVRVRCFLTLRCLIL